MADDFRAMQPITLGVRVTEERTAYFPSLILDYAPGSSLTVGVPMDQGMEVRLRPDTDVTLDVFAASGVVRYKTRVRGRSDSPPSVHLDWPSGSQRIQRREHFRVAIQVPIQGSATLGADRQPFRGNTMDISAGGMRLRLSQAMQAGTLLDMRITLPKSTTSLPCQARVIRSGIIEGAPGMERYWNGVEFVNMTEGVRKEITRFVFEVQREQMRKGLI